MLDLWCIDLDEYMQSQSNPALEAGEVTDVSGYPGFKQVGLVYTDTPVISSADVAPRVFNTRLEPVVVNVTVDYSVSQNPIPITQCRASVTRVVRTSDTPTSYHHPPNFDFIALPLAPGVYVHLNK